MNVAFFSTYVTRDRLAVLVNRYVVAAFVLQTMSYAILVGFFEHGDVTSLIALLRGLPTMLAAPLGVFALPALGITLALGAVIEFGLGVSLQGVGTGLVASDDLPFLVVAYLLSVGVAHLVTRVRQWSGRLDSDG